MGFNLTGTQVRNTYQKLTQISGSYLTNGTGSVIPQLNIIASNATQAVNAYTASYALYAVSASYEIIQEVTSSYAQTAGFANSTQYSTIIGKPVGLVSGSGQIIIGSTTGDLAAARVNGTVANAAIAGTANAVPFAGVTGKPTLVSGSAQITVGNTVGLFPASRLTGAVTASAIPWTGITGKPVGLVSGSSQISFTGLANKPVGIVSGSSQITLASTTGNLAGNRISSAVANATAAVTATSASYATTASTATSATTATSSTNAQDILLYVRNTSGAIIEKGRVVRITGATGDNPEIALAQPTSDVLSANSIGITNEQIAINGFGYVMTSGRLLAVNTNSYTPGTNLYLGSNGTFTATPQTAPNHTVRLGQVLRQNASQGSIYIKIDNGYELSELHDVLISSPSGSGDLLQFDGSVWRNAKSLTGNYNFGGTQTFNNITVNGTGSFAYILQVTGSIVKTGENFIQLNTDSPVQRFGGVKVVDSGSLQTGSIMWDSLENHWIYEATAEGGYKAGGFLAGPRSTDIYNVQYPTANKVLKSQGEDHVTDSSITDTGAKVDFSTNVVVTGSVVASSGFTGNLSGTATSASYVAGQENYARKDQANTFTQRQTLKAGTDITGSLTFNTDTEGGVDLFQGVFPTTTSSAIRFYSGSVKRDFASNKWINMQTTPGNLPWLAISSFPENDHFAFFQPAYASPTTVKRVAFEAPIGGYGNDLFVDTSVQITGSLKTRTAAPGSNVNIGMVNITGNSFVNIAPFTTSTQNFNNSRFGFVNQTRGTAYRQAFAIENYNNTSYDNTTFGSGLYANGRGFALDLIPTGSTNINNRSSILLQNSGLNTTNIGLSATSVSIGPSTAITTGTISIGNASLPTINMTAASGSFSAVTNARFNNVRVNGSLNTNAAATIGTSLVVGTTLGVTGNTTLTGELTANNKVTFNDQVVGAVQTITPASNTGSLDCAIGNFFTLTLGSGVDTLLNPSNITAGQTINIQVTQNSGTAGTISFPSSVKFAGGTDYVATTSLSAVDVLTLVSFDGTSLLATAVKNLS